MKNSLTYFTADGNYGDATDVTVIDTSDWTATDWAHVESERANNRVFIARMISFTKEVEKRNVKN